jgi:hypothetical protein
MRARLLLTLMVPALYAPLPANAADLSAFQCWFRVDVPVQLGFKAEYLHCDLGTFVWGVLRRSRATRPGSVATRCGCIVATRKNGPCDWRRSRFCRADQGQERHDRWRGGWGRA